MGSESFFQNIKVFNIWVFPTIGVPQNRWFIMENPIKMDDLDLSKPSLSELSDPETVNCPWFHQRGFENTHVFQGHRIHGLGDWSSGGWFFMCRFGRWEIWRIRLLLIFCMGYTFLLGLHRLEIPHVGTWFIYRIKMVHSPARAMFGSFGSWLWDLEQVLPVLQSSVCFQEILSRQIGHSGWSMVPASNENGCNMRKPTWKWPTNTPFAYVCFLKCWPRQQQKSAKLVLVF